VSLLVIVGVMGAVLAARRRRSPSQGRNEGAGAVVHRVVVRVAGHSEWKDG
jgi:hypothetical protein